MTKFYICDHCKNIVQMIQDSGVNPVCCGDNMRELIANTSDGANEKHVPVVSIENNEVKVEVGSVAHPMLDVHWIQWIALETNFGFYRKDLKPNELPNASFLLGKDEKVVAVYEYCNLHGLWKTVA